MNCGWHLCERKIDGERVPCLSTDNNYVSVKQCLEERSTGHVQFDTMCTYWNASPGIGC